MSEDNDSPSDRHRVVVKLLPFVLDFIKPMVGKTFYVEELRRFCRERAPEIAPDSPGRTLRAARKAGLVAYEVPSRRDPQYEVYAVHDPREEKPMDEPQPAHSSVVGGSTAGRLIECPGSYQLVQKIPDSVESTSIWAEAGTAQHEAIAKIINDDLDPQPFLGRTMSNGITLTEEHIANLQVVKAVVDPLLTERTEFVTEVRVAFPGIEGAFGTSDFGARTGRTITMLDWKFGAGVGVDIEGSGKAQLMFYCAALRHTMPDLFKGVHAIHLGVLQPSFSPEPQMVRVKRKDLDEFEAILRRAVKLATSDQPQRKRGPWCRFAPCKPICDLWTGPLVTIDDLQTPSRARADYDQVLARLLHLADLLEPLFNEARTQAHAHLTNGGKVAGWKLVPKRAFRSWEDEEKALEVLEHAGFNVDEITSLKSPAQVEKHAKAHGLSIPASAQIQAISSGTTLARSDDPRDEAQGFSSVVESFRQAVLGLEGPKTD